MGALTVILHLAQAGFSVYNLYLASISISNLQKYEEKSKKAAEYSQTAADQLHRTRTTQASGILAIATTFLSSIAMIIYSGEAMGVVVALVNMGVLMAAREHVGNFWRGKAKIPIPGVGDYNEAIGKTNEVRLNMLYLVASWIAVGLLDLVVG